jgi:hypothetical protein
MEVMMKLAEKINKIQEDISKLYSQIDDLLFQEADRLIDRMHWRESRETIRQEINDFPESIYRIELIRIFEETYLEDL